TGSSGNGNASENANPGSGSGSNDKCWYTITIDGQTTLPNKFGKDIISFSSVVQDNQGTIGFQLGQTKANGQTILALTMTSGSPSTGLFNSTTAVGTT